MSNSEEVPKTPIRRTTRVSASSSSRIPSTIPKVSDRNLPHFAESSITLQDLLSSLPGRNTQIVELLQLIGPINSPMLPIFIYGSTSTGKTTTILQSFRHLNRPLVYISCRSCYSPRILFESILNQLLCHRKAESNGYASAKKCEKASEFVNLLKDAILRVLGELNDPKNRMGDRKMVYFVFDNVESIRNWDKNGAVLSLLFKIGDILRINEVGFMYVSSSRPDGYYLSSGSIEPVNVYFPDYKVEDLHAILMRNQSYPKLYYAFLSAVLKPFYRITRRVDELSIALEPLFKIYCDPLDDLKVVPDEAMKRRLFDYIQPHLVAALNETFKVPAWSSNEFSNVEAGKQWHTRKLREETCKELEFHMSTSAKYLLLSAFLASRNPATLDASLFDSTGGFDNRKRRRNSKTSNDNKELTAQETFMKGPGSFPLERLLAIFQCITSVDDSYESECTEEESTSRNEKIGLMSDVLLQLSTLCNANFLCKSGSCQLDVSTRYRSTVDEELALKVARSINFPLSKYMYR